MSGIVGHTMDALLGLQAAAGRKLPLAAIAQRHLASYLAGAYLGCDIQAMPEAICLDTGREVGFGTVPLEKSPITGGPVRQFRLATPEGALTAQQIFARFYGRSHLVFGWMKKEEELRVPWDHLADYCAAAIEDAFEFYGAGERPIAYALGWVAHIVSDSLIKGIQPGIELQLVDGRYTPRNRPVQDLVTYHEIGEREFKLHWPALLADLAATPVEEHQLHYMRSAERRGQLGALFTDGWQPESAPLLRVVLAENRRYLPHHIADVLADMTLPDGDCSAAQHELTGLHYPEMIEACEHADFRHTLWKIADEIGAMLEAISHRSPRLAAISATPLPDWPQLTERWRRKS
jgi:hypothetical protein